MAKFKHLISKEAVNNKCYAKYAFWKVFKKSHKTIKEFTPSNANGLFYSKGIREASGHSKGTQTAFGHSRHSGTRTLDALGHSQGTWALNALGHLGTRRALRHSGSRALEALYLADSSQLTGFYLIANQVIGFCLTLNQLTGFYLTANKVTGFYSTVNKLTGFDCKLNWLVSLAKDWIFICEISDCEFRSRCIHLNFRHCAFFEQKVPWRSSSYRG